MIHSKIWLLWDSFRPLLMECIVHLKVIIRGFVLPFNVVLTDRTHRRYAVQEEERKPTSNEWSHNHPWRKNRNKNYNIYKIFLSWNLVTEDKRCPSFFLSCNSSFLLFWVPFRKIVSLFLQVFTNWFNRGLSSVNHFSGFFAQSWKAKSIFTQNFCCSYLLPSLSLGRIFVLSSMHPVLWPQSLDKSPNSDLSSLLFIPFSSSLFLGSNLSSFFCNEKYKQDLGLQCHTPF